MNKIGLNFQHKVIVNSKNIQQPITENKLNTTNTDANLKKPASEHYKANFMIAFGNNDNDKPRTEFELEASKPKLITDKYDRNPFLSPKTFTNAPFYNNNANELAIMLGATNNVLLTYDDKTCMPQLLIDKFQLNVNEGKYKGKGLLPFKTKVINYDFRQTTNISFDNIINITEHNKSMKSIIIIPDFDKFLINFKKAPLLKKMREESGYGDNVQIIGLISKSALNATIKNEEDGFDAIINNFKQLDVEIPSDKQTKQLLKSNSRLLSSVTQKYKNLTITTTEGAIDAIVDRAAINIAGDFPGKALNVYDLIISAKLQKTRKFEPGKPTLITKKDVDSFFDNHTNITDKLRPQKGMFKKVDIPKTGFNDVGGANDAKEVIRDGILAYIKDPKAYLKTGQKPPKGILMYGEPGTGKTLLARAIAGEAKVPFFSISGSNFVEKYVGIGASRVRELFSEARNAAKASENKTAIIFIDEIDSLGKKRTGESSGGKDENTQTLNQLLAEMDGFENNSKLNIIVIAATNNKDVLDPALVRAGRFDDKIEIPNPSKSKADRLEILQIHSRQKLFKNEEDKKEILDNASDLSAGLSGAEMEDMMSRAAKIANKRGKENYIQPNDLVESFLQVKAGPIKAIDSLDSDLFSTVSHECGHALLCKTINDISKQPWKKISNISFITNQPRGGYLGAVYFKPGEESRSPNFDTVIALAARSYAGGVTEHMYKEGRHSAGVSADLKNASEWIESAVTKWGQGPNVGLISIPDKSKLRKLYSKEIKKDIEVLTKTAQKVSELVIDFNKGFISEYMDDYKANAGQGGKTLLGEEFIELHNKWLADNNKEKEQIILEKKIDILINSARKGKILSDKDLEKKLKA